MKKLPKEEKDFVPEVQQIKFLQVYLNQEQLTPLSELCKLAGIDEGKLKTWQTHPEFNQWFYNELQSNKHRYGARIVSNLAIRAADMKAPAAIVELALGVLGLYHKTSTLKIVDDEFQKTYRDEIDRIKRRAIELRKSGELPSENAIIVDEAPKQIEGVNGTTQAASS